MLSAEARAFASLAAVRAHEDRVAAPALGRCDDRLERAVVLGVLGILNATPAARVLSLAGARISSAFARERRRLRLARKFNARHDRLRSSRIRRLESECACTWGVSLISGIPTDTPAPVWSCGSEPSASRCPAAKPSRLSCCARPSGSNRSHRPAGEREDPSAGALQIARTGCSLRGVLAARLEGAVHGETCFDGSGSALALDQHPHGVFAGPAEIEHLAIVRVACGSHR